jgi:LPXTG-motif cell wall-anchored protein
MLLPVIAFFPLDTFITYFPFAEGYTLKREVTKMTALFMIIGGAVGGGAGWFFDRKRQNQTAANPQPEDTCATST